MSLTMQDAQRMEGLTVVGPDGSKIGTVADVYIDNDTQQPEWAVVSTGMFGMRESFVPLAEASLTSDEVAVPYDKDLVKGAPTAEPDGELSQDEEAQLYAHYGLNYSESKSDSGYAAPGKVQAGMAATTSTDTGTSTDNAMTRSEEQLKVGVSRRPSETVRLRKRIVTENVNITVPVTSERAVITREPITDANRDDAVSGPDISEGEYEITLSEERPVVSKETVAMERVSLGVESETHDETVSDTVRKEVIETDGLDDKGAPRA